MDPFSSSSGHRDLPIGGGASSFSENKYENINKDKKPLHYEFHTPAELLQDPRSLAQQKSESESGITTTDVDEEGRKYEEQLPDVRDLPPLPDSRPSSKRSSTPPSSAYQRGPSSPLYQRGAGYYEPDLQNLPALPDSRPSSKRSSKTPSPVYQRGAAQYYEPDVRDLPPLPDSRPSSKRSSKPPSPVYQRGSYDPDVRDLPPLPDSRPSSKRSSTPPSSLYQRGVGHDYGLDVQSLPPLPDSRPSSKRSSNPPSPVFQRGYYEPDVRDLPALPDSRPSSKRSSKPPSPVYHRGAGYYEPDLQNLPALPDSRPSSKRSSTPPSSVYQRGVGRYYEEPPDVQNLPPLPDSRPSSKRSSTPPSSVYQRGAGYYEPDIRDLPPLPDSRPSSKRSSNPPSPVYQRFAARDYGLDVQNLPPLPDSRPSSKHSSGSSVGQRHMTALSETEAPFMSGGLRGGDPRILDLKNLPPLPESHPSSPVSDRQGPEEVSHPISPKYLRETEHQRSPEIVHMPESLSSSWDRIGESDLEESQVKQDKTTATRTGHEVAPAATAAVAGAGAATVAERSLEHEKEGRDSSADYRISVPGGFERSDVEAGQSPRGTFANDILGTSTDATSEGRSLELTPSDIETRLPGAFGKCKDSADEAGATSTTGFAEKKTESTLDSGRGLEEENATTRSPPVEYGMHLPGSFEQADEKTEQVSDIQREGVAEDSTQNVHAQPAESDLPLAVEKSEPAIAAAEERNQDREIPAEERIQQNQERSAEEVLPITAPSSSRKKDKKSKNKNKKKEQALIEQEQQLPEQLPTQEPEFVTTKEEPISSAVGGEKEIPTGEYAPSAVDEEAAAAAAAAEKQTSKKSKRDKKQKRKNTAISSEELGEGPRKESREVFDESVSPPKEEQQPLEPTEHERKPFASPSLGNFEQATPTEERATSQREETFVHQPAEIPSVESAETAYPTSHLRHTEKDSFSQEEPPITGETGDKYAVHIPGSFDESGPTKSHEKYADVLEREAVAAPVEVGSTFSDSKKLLQEQKEPLPEEPREARDFIPEYSEEQGQEHQFFTGDSDKTRERDLQDTTGEVTKLPETMPGTFTSSDDLPSSVQHADVSTTSARELSSSYADTEDKAQEETGLDTRATDIPLTKKSKKDKKAKKRSHQQDEPEEFVSRELNQTADEPMNNQAVEMDTEESLGRSRDVVEQQPEVSETLQRSGEAEELGEAVPMTAAQRKKARKEKKDAKKKGSQQLDQSEQPPSHELTPTGGENDNMLIDTKDDVALSRDVVEEPAIPQSEVGESMQPYEHEAEAEEELAPMTAAQRKKAKKGKKEARKALQQQEESEELALGEPLQTDNENYQRPENEVSKSRDVTEEPSETQPELASSVHQLHGDEAEQSEGGVIPMTAAQRKKAKKEKKGAKKALQQEELEQPPSHKQFQAGDENDSQAERIGSEDFLGKSREAVDEPAAANIAHYGGEAEEQEISIPMTAAQKKKARKEKKGAKKALQQEEPFQGGDEGEDRTVKMDTDDVVEESREPSQEVGDTLQRGYEEDEPEQIIPMMAAQRKKSKKEKQKKQKQAQTTSTVEDPEFSYGGPNQTAGAAEEEAREAPVHVTPSADESPAPAFQGSKEVVETAGDTHTSYREEEEPEQSQYTEEGIKNIPEGATFLGAKPMKEDFPSQSSVEVPGGHHEQERQYMPSSQDPVLHHVHHYESFVPHSVFENVHPWEADDEQRSRELKGEDPTKTALPSAVHHPEEHQLGDDTEDLSAPAPAEQRLHEPESHTQATEFDPRTVTAGESTMATRAAEETETPSHSPFLNTASEYYDSNNKFEPHPSQILPNRPNRRQLSPSPSDYGLTSAHDDFEDSHEPRTYSEEPSMQYSTSDRHQVEHAISKTPTVGNEDAGVDQAKDSRARPDYDRDVEFTATVAAATQATGFDPRMVTGGEPYKSTVATAGPTREVEAEETETPSHPPFLNTASEYYDSNTKFEPHPSQMLPDRPNRRQLSPSPTDYGLASAHNDFQDYHERKTYSPEPSMSTSDRHQVEHAISETPTVGNEDTGVEQASKSVEGEPFAPDESEPFTTMTAKEKKRSKKRQKQQRENEKAQAEAEETLGTEKNMEEINAGAGEEPPATTKREVGGEHTVQDTYEKDSTALEKSDATMETTRDVMDTEATEPPKKRNSKKEKKDKKKKKLLSLADYEEEEEEREKEPEMVSKEQLSKEPALERDIPTEEKVHSHQLAQGLETDSRKEHVVVPEGEERGNYERGIEGPLEGVQGDDDTRISRYAEIGESAGAPALNETAKDTRELPDESAWPISKKDKQKNKKSKRREKRSTQQEEEADTYRNKEQEEETVAEPPVTTGASRDLNEEATRQGSDWEMLSASRKTEEDSPLERATQRAATAQDYSTEKQLSSPTPAERGLGPFTTAASEKPPHTDVEAKHGQLSYQAANTEEETQPTSREMPPAAPVQPLHHQSIFGGPYGEPEPISPPLTPTTPLTTGMGMTRDGKESESGHGEQREVPSGRKSPGLDERFDRPMQVSKTRRDRRENQEDPFIASRAGARGPSLKQRSGGDLRSANQKLRNNAKTQPPLDVDDDDLEPVASSSTYNASTDKGKRPIRGDMTDVYVSFSF